MLTKIILDNNTSKEFFIQKAIGWTLREYSKTNPEWVVNFVNTYPLMPLSKREAVKRALIPELSIITLMPLSKREAVKRIKN